MKNNPDPVQVRRVLADAIPHVQQVYDDWGAKERKLLPPEHPDHEGICSYIAVLMAGHLLWAGFKALPRRDRGHTKVQIVAEGYSLLVDIPCRVYEARSGRGWIKKTGVRFTVDDITIERAQELTASELFWWNALTDRALATMPRSITRPH